MQAQEKWKYFLSAGKQIEEKLGGGGMDARKLLVFS